jgi:AraC family transcriptional regulator
VERDVFQSLITGGPVLTKRPIRTPHLSVSIQESGPAFLPALFATHHLIAVPLGEGYPIARLDADGRWRGRLESGDIAIVPAGTRQRVVWPAGARCLYIHFHPAWLSRADSIAYLPRVRDLRLHELGRAMYELVGNNDQATEATALAIAALMAERLTSHYAAPAAPSPTHGLQRITDVLDRLRLNATPMSMTALAAECGLTRSHFTRQFRAIVGASPYALSLASRVEHAKRLLHHRRISIASVAFECGFADQAHLTRAFKQHTGTTPAAFTAAFP